MDFVPVDYVEPKTSEATFVKKTIPPINLQPAINIVLKKTDPNFVGPPEPPIKIITTEPVPITPQTPVPGPRLPPTPKFSPSTQSTFIPTPDVLKNIPDKIIIQTPFQPLPEYQEAKRQERQDLYESQVLNFAGPEPDFERDVIVQETHKSTPEGYDYVGKVLDEEGKTKSIFGETGLGLTSVGGAIDYYNAQSTEFNTQADAYNLKIDEGGKKFNTLMGGGTSTINKPLTQAEVVAATPLTGSDVFGEVVTGIGFKNIGMVVGTVLAPGPGTVIGGIVGTVLDANVNYNDYIAGSSKKSSGSKSLSALPLVTIGSVSTGTSVVDMVPGISWAVSLVGLGSGIMNAGTKLRTKQDEISMNAISLTDRMSSFQSRDLPFSDENVVINKKEGIIGNIEEGTIIGFIDEMPGVTIVEDPTMREKSNRNRNSDSNKNENNNNINVNDEDYNIDINQNDNNIIDANDNVIVDLNKNINVNEYGNEYINEYGYSLDTGYGTGNERLPGFGFVLPAISLGSGSRMPGRTTRASKISLGSGYSPDIKSILFNITGKKPTKTSTGFENRPISIGLPTRKVTKKSKKKKKKNIYGSVITL